MGQKLIFVFLLIAMAVLLTGCPFFVSSAHTRHHSNAIHKNMVEIHAFLDRHFWLNDWEDPHIN